MDESKYVLKEEFNLIVIELVKLREFVLNDVKSTIDAMQAFNDGLDHVLERISILEDDK